MVASEYNKALTPLSLAELKANEVVVVLLRLKNKPKFVCISFISTFTQICKNMLDYY